MLIYPHPPFLDTYKKIKLATIVVVGPKPPFSSTTTPRCWGLLQFTLDTYLNVNHGGNKYHFLNLRYDSTWDRTLVSWAIGEHSIHKVNGKPYASSWVFSFFGPFVEVLSSSTLLLLLLLFTHKRFSHQR